MTKLPVWLTVKAAYEATWAQRWRLLRFAAVPFALIVAIELGATHLSEALPEPLADNGPEGWFPLSAAIDELSLFLTSVVLIAFAVPYCRLLLLGPAAIDAGRRWPVWRVYLGMLAVTFLVALVFDLPLALLGHFAFSEEAELDGTVSFVGLFAGPALLAFVAVYVTVTVRLVFIYPVICLARPWDLAQRWRETRGNFWRLCAAFIIALLPLLALVVLFALWQETMWDESSNVGLFESLAVAILELFAEAFCVAVTVIAFAQLTGYLAKGVRVPVARPESGFTQGPGSKELSRKQGE